MLLRPVLRPLLRPLLRSPLERDTGGWSPRNISFTSGLWLDPSDISTGFQSVDGKTAQTASGQLTGLRMDKSQALALGSDIVTDGGFANSGSWTQETNWVVGGGVATSTASVAGRFCYQTPSVTLVAGEVWEVTYTISSISVGGVAVEIGGTNTTTRTAAGTYTERIRTAASRQLLGLSSIGASTTAVVDNLSVKKVTGLHVSQATSSARPEYDVISGISSDYFDGLDDGYSTAVFAAGTLVNGMDLFIAIKRATTAQMVIFSQAPTDGAKFCAIDGSVSGAFPGMGATFTIFVDGVAVGTAGSCTRLQLGTALGSGAYHVLEARDLDLSTWTQFTLGLYTSFMLNADLGGVVLCPSQSAATRAKLRTWLGAKVGLSL